MSQHKTNSVLYVEFKYELEFPKQSFHTFAYMTGPTNGKTCFGKRKKKITLCHVQYNIHEMRPIFGTFSVCLVFAFDVPCFFNPLSECRQ